MKVSNAYRVDILDSMHIVLDPVKCRPVTFVTLSPVPNLRAEEIFVIAQDIEARCANTYADQVSIKYTLYNFYATICNCS